MRAAILLLVLIFGALLSGCQSTPLAVSSPPGASSRAKESGEMESPYLPLDEISEGRIVDVPTGLEVDQARLMQSLSGARIVYIGEVHDNLEDHRVQLAVLKEMSELFPGKVAVGMEMFPHTAQGELDRWIAGELSEREFLRLWYQHWGMDERIYQDLLSFIHQEKIPLIGLNAPAEMVRAVSEKGIGGLSESERRQLPEIDRSDPYYRRALHALFRGHGPGTDAFEGFFETMLLWDETMAQSAASYLQSPGGRDRKLIVFTGDFHVAFGFGVPRRTFRRLREPYRILLPYSKSPEPETPAGPPMRLQMEEQVPDLPLYYADFVWAVPYKTIGVPRTRLGIQVEAAGDGLKITEVHPGSAAEAAGLKKGDTVTAFDGVPVKEPFDLSYAVQKKSAGEKGNVSLVRDGKAMNVDVLFKPP